MEAIDTDFNFFNDWNKQLFFLTKLEFSVLSLFPLIKNKDRKIKYISFCTKIKFWIIKKTNNL
jgi:hypothetical protein